MSNGVKAVLAWLAVLLVLLMVGAMFQGQSMNDIWRCMELAQCQR